jgi:hypothetical protein
MKPVDCEFESEVLAAVLQGRWPDHVDAGLRAHAEACGICADVAAIAGAIDESREEMRARAVVPDSGRVWWLAQMRARREAAQAAGRPITAAQVIALACAMGVLGACFGATSAWFQSALRRMGSALVPFAAGHGLLLLGMAAMLLVIPVAVYLTLLRD